MEIKAVIFDLGGTLIEYAGEYSKWPDLEAPGLLAAYSCLDESGFDLPPLDLFKNTGFELLPGRWQSATAGTNNLTVPIFLADILTSLGIPKPEDDALLRAAERYEQAICIGATAIAHSQETLRDLKACGYKIGLISNTMFSGKAHLADLEKFDLASHFDAMLFSGDVNMWKPTAAPFKQAVADLGATTQSAVFVGDDPMADIIGAQRAGLPAIYFPSGHRFASLDNLEPDATIHHLRELPGAIERLNQWPRRLNGLRGHDTLTLP